MNKYTIFGNPVVHSKSPQMQNAGFQYLKKDALYTKHLLENGEDIKKEFIKHNYSGANITVPHKELAYKNADEVIGIAKKIKAVNTYIKKDGKILAYNTDALGFFKAIQSFGNIKKVLLLGAGGTAKAIALILQEKKIDITVLNRSQKRLEFFTSHNIKAKTWDNFKIENYDLVVNSTSAGLKDDNLPCPKELLKNILKNSSFAFDCIYGKETPFLNLAQQNGLKIKDGEDMLLYQGVLAFEYFTKQTATETTIEIMRKALKDN